MEMRKLKELAGLPDSMSGKAVYNAIIRECFPGGPEILDLCERLHQANHGREHKDPMLQDLLDTALQARDKMAEALKHSEDGTITIDIREIEA
jgi:hypothetical protein